MNSGSFRRTTQILAPSVHVPCPDVFNIYPAQPLSGGRIEVGFAALAARLAAHTRVVIDGVVGVLWDDFRARLSDAFAQLGLSFRWVDLSGALRPETEIDALIAPFLGGDDPLFGTRCTASLRQFFDAARLAAIRRDVASCADRTIVYGTGATFASGDGVVVWVEVPKNEIQFRSRAGAVRNLGASARADAKAIYKRFYFVDWPASRRRQRDLLPRIDLVVDSQRPDEPACISGDDLRSGLQQAARTSFRVRPWFEPGPWGGQWMKRRFPGLSPDAPNLAWSFELISPENGLAFGRDDRLCEVSFDWLMIAAHEAVLGDYAARFGLEFPIRFDYLDTFDGGNLSVQCHPRPEYSWRHFGERFTQDECYYLTDSAPGASVFLGFQDGIDSAQFRAALEASARDAAPLDVGRYVQSHPARAHSLYLIPNGTIHASGRNNLVLEISSTPYIFTFKMYDWMRMDLDGRPRTLSIGRAMENLYFDRQGERVGREFISRPMPLDGGEGWELTHLPTHAEHFYDVRRFDLTGTATASTDGSPHVLNVVGGPSVVLETPGAAPKRFAFAETFVVPAAAGSYRLTTDTGAPVKVVDCFLKASARDLPGYLG